jgi:elongation factor P
MRKPQNQVKLKSLISGRTWNATFHAADKVNEADIIKREVKFLYTNKGEYWFASPTDAGDRFKIEEKIIGAGAKYLKTDGLVTAMIWDDDDEEKIIKISVPIKMEFTIKEAPPSIRGNTANGGGKLAVLENGVKIQVPFFVEEGDKVVVNTESGEYVERVGK